MGSLGGLLKEARGIGIGNSPESILKDRWISLSLSPPVTDSLLSDSVLSLPLAKLSSFSSPMCLVQKPPSPLSLLRSLSLSLLYLCPSLSVASQVRVLFLLKETRSFIMFMNP